MKEKFIKAFLGLGLTGSLLMQTLMPVCAATTASTEIQVTTVATEVSVTIPLTVACTINPNLETPFVHADMTVKNDTVAPILFSVNTFQQASAFFENDIKPDGLPKGKTWDKLNVTDTKKYFSLGLKPVDTETQKWSSMKKVDTTYVKDVADSVSDINLGVINSLETVNIDIEATHGFAFKSAENFSYNLIFTAELYDGE